MSVPLVGSKPPVQVPSALRGWTKPEAGFSVPRQSCARLAYVRWSAVAPSAPANAESAKSAVLYSSVVATGP